MLQPRLLFRFCSRFFRRRLKVFANQFFDICRAAGVDYDVVKEGASRDSRIGPSHFNVLADGYRGYGGPCLPKDVRALIQFAESVHVRPELLNTLETINKKLGQR
ncbi:MAG TPA: hypothetical protein VMU07_03460 [Candidatus Paceibacterota bacterium]|nr:hypothetical protein [Candidatus Paceibacterota bacterium]